MDRREKGEQKMSEIIPYQDIEKMGTAVASSGLFGLKTKDQAIALMLVAQALGKHPALAAMEYNIIQGRPAKKAEAIQADFQAAGGKIEWHELTDTKAEATFSHPSGGSLKLDWTMERAKKAGLFDKENYKKYPRQMLKARVVADGVRAVYPAAMGGVRAVEEMDDTSADETPIPAGKSRVEAMVEAQTTEKHKDVQDAEIKPKEEPKKTKKEKPATPVAEPSADPAIQYVTGVITGQPRTGEVNGKTKYLFKIEDKEYGTFDTSIVEKVMEVVDMQQKKPELRFLVKFGYTVRPSAKTAGLMFQDITSFSQVTTDEVEVPI